MKLSRAAGNKWLRYKFLQKRCFSTRRVIPSATAFHLDLLTKGLSFSLPNAIGSSVHRKKTQLGFDCCKASIDFKQLMEQGVPIKTGKLMESPAKLSFVKPNIDRRTASGYIRPPFNSLTFLP